MTLTPSQIISFAILGTIILVLGVVAFRTRGAAGLKDAGKSSGALFLAVLPNLALGFTIAGLLAVLLPREAIGRLMGEGSGWRGLCFGSVAGMITPGGPFTHFPILAGFLKAGAGPGPVAAYVAGWALLGVNRIVIWEIPILGWKFVVVRIVSCLFVPPVVGLISGFLYRRLAV